MKKRLLCPKLPNAGASVRLSDTEAHHAVRVCRLQDGDIVEALDGNGHRAWVTLRTRGGPTRIEHIPVSKEGISPESPSLESKPLPIILEIAVLKAEAMEWVVEKAVELGVATLVPVLTAHTVVQVKDKGPTYFQERWQKIADQALKQCGRASRLIIQAPIPLQNLFTAEKSQTRSIRLWCDESKESQPLYLLDWLKSHDPLPYEKIAILIGPEGGWSTLEREMLSKESSLGSVQKIDLGPFILRAETAAIFASSLVSAYLRNATGLDK